jgi:hypothetical protein
MASGAERRDLVAKLEQSRSELLELARSLTPERAESRKQEGDRTPKGMLLHVAEAEQHYVWNWAARARDEDEPDFALPRLGTGGGVGGLFDEAGDWDVPGLTSRMRGVRESTLRFIGATTDAEFDRVGRNSPFGDLTVYQFLKSLYRHDRMHIDEMQGRDQTYIIKTADGRQL